MGDNKVGSIHKDNVRHKEDNVKIHMILPQSFDEPIQQTHNTTTQTTRTSGSQEQGVVGRVIDGGAHHAGVAALLVLLAALGS